MDLTRKVLLVVTFATLLMGATRMEARTTEDAARKEIEEFNKKFSEVILKMDNAAVMSLWAEDGVGLLPGMAPMTGKKAISDWLDDLVAKMPEYRVTKQENEYHDIQISDDKASEWGTTYQVELPDGRPQIENRGKILLALHKEKDGHWKIKQEMWNVGPRP